MNHHHQQQQQQQQSIEGPDEDGPLLHDDPQDVVDVGDVDDLVGTDLVVGGEPTDDGIGVEDDLTPPSSPTKQNGSTSESPRQHHPRGGKKKRDSSSLRKAPQAPKRFKSSYICFFMAKQPEIKEALGDKATVTEISKRSAEMWRNLPNDQRAHWDDVAQKDKQRYMDEKATYTGPWQVPYKRAKKDPSAPKRPMSAFLYFSQGRRRAIKKENPDMKNTEVSRLLGEMWRTALPSERQPHIDKEKTEREKYKVAMAKWKKDYEVRMEQQRQAQAMANTTTTTTTTGATLYSQAPFGGNGTTVPMVPVGEGGNVSNNGNAHHHHHHHPPPIPHPPKPIQYGDPNTAAAPYYMPPPHQSYPHPPQFPHLLYPPPPSQPYQYHLGASATNMVVLGPNGMPHYPAPPPPPPPAAPHNAGSTNTANSSAPTTSGPASHTMSYPPPTPYAAPNYDHHRQYYNFNDEALFPHEPEAQTVELK